MSNSETRGIDRASAIPFYYQLQEILKEEIERGTWQPGDLLPSEADLEQRFGVSRTVIRQALDVLEADGQISRGKGRRTQVAEPKFRWDATIGVRHWNEAATLGRVSLGKLVDARRVPAGGGIGRVLGVDAASSIFELTFTQEVGGAPAALSQMYLRPDASPRLAAACSTQDQLPILLEHGPDVAEQLASAYDIVIAAYDATVELTKLNEFEAQLLAVPLGSPAFLITARDLDIAQSPLSLTRTVIRGDRFRFSLMMRQPDADGSQRSPGLMAFMS